MSVVSKSEILPQLYTHIGLEFPSNLRFLEEKERRDWSHFGYIAYEKYPEEKYPVTGRYYTFLDLYGCNGVSPNRELSLDIPNEIYCVHCHRNFSINQFVLTKTKERVLQ
jgi:hypothetical protein